MIVWVSVVLKRIVGDSDWRFDNLSVRHLQTQSSLTLKMSTAQVVET